MGSELSRSGVENPRNLTASGKKACRTEKTENLFNNMDSGTQSKLNKLQIYLDHLPDSLPFRGSAESDYGFDFFGIRDEDEEDLGLEGAVNRQLEVRLGHRNNGPAKFKERGPGLSSVVTVLENYLKDLPGSVILMKWLDDLICSAQQAFENAKHPVSIEYYE
jgi:hypothetical protein